MGTPHEGSLAGEAWQLISELFQREKGVLMAAAAEFDLRPPLVWALRALEPGRPIPMGELAGVLHCDSSNVTWLADRLEERGLVRREAAEHDRRVKMLAVTEEGSRVREALRARLEQPPPTLAALPEDDQRALRDILRRAQLSSGGSARGPSG